MIEEMPSVIQKVKKNLEGIEKAREELAGFDTRKAVKGEVLEQLQVIEHHINDVAQRSKVAEEDTARYLESVSRTVEKYSIEIIIKD